MKVLLIGDPNLGERALSIVQATFSDTELVVYRKGVPGSRDAAVRRIIDCDEQVLLSFYNDLRIPVQALDRAAANVNIHPALPHVGGVGYDVVPVLRRHDTYGATAHRMDEEFDHGDIYRVIERRRGNWNYARQRRANQAVTLSLLIQVVKDLEYAGSPASYAELMAEQAQKLQRKWGEYFDIPTVKGMLEETYQSDPGHPVFKGNVKFFAAYGQPVGAALHAH